MQRFIIHDGLFDYTSVQEGSDPFYVKVSAIEYAATDISLHSFYRIAHGADIKADIEMGEAVAKLTKVGSSHPATCSLEGVDLGTLDKLFDQSDALVVAGGRMDVKYSVNKEQDTNIEVSISRLELAQNADASVSELFFIPLEKVIAYVQSKGGQIELSYVARTGRGR